MSSGRTSYETKRYVANFTPEELSGVEKLMRLLQHTNFKFITGLRVSDTIPMDMDNKED